ncbi:MAG: ABC transporter permease [Clostridia bacterium]|nr:ABC transporter permease [Clostridia bacterium]
MTVFRTFLKVLKACIVPIILYTVILVAFGGFNMKTSDTSTAFVSSKPDIFIVNNDTKNPLTNNLIQYISENSNIIDIENDEEKINDALFYRDVNYIIYIPKNYGEDFFNGKDPKIEIKSTGDYQASLAEMILSRYIKVANIYKDVVDTEEELISKINNTLEKQAEVEITSSLDTDNLSKATFYYNFASYSILAGCVYVICLILSSFQSDKIKKRTVISSMNYKKYNRDLLLSNSLFAIVLWMFYVLLSIILVGNVMFTMHGLVYIANAFVFTICGLTIAFLIGNLVNNKNAINGIVNVIALGSSFLCGAFVPMEFLPDSVLKVAHILPTYYYISSNEMIAKLETFSIEAMRPIITNMIIIVVFSVIFVILSNIVSKRKQKIG